MVGSKRILMVRSWTWMRGLRMRQLVDTKENQEHSRNLLVHLLKTNPEMHHRSCLEMKWLLVRNSNQMLKINHHSLWSLTNNSSGVKQSWIIRMLMVHTNQWLKEMVRLLKLIMTNCKIKNWTLRISQMDIHQEVMNKCVLQNCMQLDRMVQWANNLLISFRAMKKCVNQPMDNKLTQVFKMQTQVFTSLWVWINYRNIYLREEIQVLVLMSNTCLIKWCKIIIKIGKIILP